MRGSGRDEAITPADRLRELIREAEIILANLKGAGPGRATRLLELLDEIEQESQTLAAVGFDLRAEAGRISGIQDGLRARKALLLRELRPAGGLEALRSARRPAGERWWWFLDQELRRERRLALRRGLRIGAAAAGLLAAAFAIVRIFFWPDPTVVETTRNQHAALQHIMEGDLAAAMPYIRENMELEPGNAEWPIRLGVLEEVAGDPARSEELFRLGRRLAADELDFRLQRAQYYLDVGDPARALADARRATEIAPDEPLGFFLLARAHVGMGQPEEAIRAYERVLELAEKSRGHETLYVMAKLDLSELYQRALSTPAAGQ